MRTREMMNDDVLFVKNTWDSSTFCAIVCSPPTQKLRVDTFDRLVLFFRDIFGKVIMTD